MLIAFVLRPAYDLDDDCGSHGDLFMEELQSISTRIPYVFGVGDHEAGRKADSSHNQGNGWDYNRYHHTHTHAL